MNDTFTCTKKFAFNVIHTQDPVVVSSNAARCFRNACMCMFYHAVEMSMTSLNLLCQSKNKCLPKMRGQCLYGAKQMLNNENIIQALAMLNENEIASCL